jgi:hypothetical protein
MYAALKSGQDRALSTGTALVAAAVLALALVLALAGTASANPIASGSTALKLDRGVAKVLSQNKVKVAPVKPASVVKGQISFPITGGNLNPTNAAGTIRHSGGLRFQAGKRKLVVRNFTVNTVKRTLTAQVGKARVPLLSLNLSKAKVSRNGLGVVVRNVGVALTGTAASALNKTFKVKLFKKGLRIGSVTVTALPASVKLAATGATELQVSGAALAALGGLGVAPAAIAPGTLAGDTFSFPITGGMANTSTFAGEVLHSGGISLSKDATTVLLSDFTINVDEAPDLVATLGGAGGPRVSILDLDLSALTAEVNGRNITLGNVEANLTAAAAGALNDAFAIPAPGIPAGFNLGTATVNAVAR